MLLLPEYLLLLANLLSWDLVIIMKRMIMMIIMMIMMIMMTIMMIVTW